MRRSSRFRRTRLEALEARQLLASDLQIAADILPCIAESAPAIATAEPLAALPAAEAQSAKAQSADRLKMIVRDIYQPGIPVLVRVQVEDADGRVDRTRWDAVATLSTDNPLISLSQTEVPLVNGMGSVLIDIQGAGPFNLTAQLDQMEDVRPMEAFKQLGVPLISGVLTGEATTLSGIVQIGGDLTVPAGHVLTIEPGTLVLINGAAQAPKLELGVRIIVEGTLNAQGTEERPVTFTATDADKPWGEINVSGGDVTLTYTNLTRAGSSRRGGHTNTGPALRLRSDGILKLDHSNVTDVAGKIMQATSGELTILDSLLTRAVMGPEIQDTSLLFADSWIVEMAGVYHHNGTVDDNDGIYLHTQKAGQTIELRRSVVANVQDDGIDTLGPTILVDDVIVRDVTDKTMSIFNGAVTIRRALLINGEIGIEAKGVGNSTVDVSIDRTTIANVDWGIRAFDKGSPDPNVKITYDIANSIIDVRDGGDPLFTDYDPADLRVNYTWVNEDWSPDGSGEGNVRGLPLFVDAAANDYRLADGSPAIDAGDPSSPLDDDATRADMGYFASIQSTAPDADFNGDGVVDADDIDLLCAALESGDTDDRFDLDGNGQLEKADMDFLIFDLLHTTYGDANLDGVFNSDDLVLVLQSGQYEDAVGGNSRWATGDWNCDGDFTTSDLVVALQAGGYVAEAKPIATR